MTTSIEIARSEILSRFTREVTPRMVKFGSPSAKGRRPLLEPVAGSLVVYWTRPGNDLLVRLQKALQKGDRTALGKLSKQAEALIKVEEQPLVGRLVEELRAAECVFDVRHRGKALAENRTLLYGNEFSTATLSFLGGTLATGDIRILEYHRGTPARAPRFEYLICHRVAELTTLERAAVNKLAKAETGAVIVPGAWPDENKQKPMTEVADVVACMVDDAKKGFDPGIFEHLEEQLATGKIDPHAAVQELIKLRFEIVQRAMRRTR